MNKMTTLSDDLLEGSYKIAAFMFGDASKANRRKVYYLASDVKSGNRLPIFRLGATICARKSTLIQWIAAQENRDPAAA